MNRILVRTPNWIGDQIMAYPFFLELRKKHPQAWITAICAEWVKDIQFKGLVDEVVILPQKKDDHLLTTVKNIYDFSKRLKQMGPWDLGISLPNSFSSALMLYLASVKYRRGYDTDARGILLNQKIKWDPSHEVHRAQAYLNLLAPEVKVLLKAPEFDPIRHWPDIEPIEPPRDAYFIVAPGATADSRRWSTLQFSELIQLITEKYGYRAVVVGGKAEREVAGQLFRLGVRIDDFTGRGWVSAHWKLFKSAKFTVCNESGLAHVAALCGSKVQIICGAADPRRTRPIGPGKVQVKVNAIDCWPCEKNVCLFQDDRKVQCLKGISAQDVLKEVERGLLTP